MSPATALVSRYAQPAQSGREVGKGISSGLEDSSARADSSGSSCHSPYAPPTPIHSTQAALSDNAYVPQTRSKVGYRNLRYYGKKNRF